MRSFDEGILVLEGLVGDGLMEGVLEFNQVYASAQHTSTWFSGPLRGHIIRHHPHGGGPHYITEPMLEEAGVYMQTVADHVLTDGTVAGMVAAVEKWADDASPRAPVEFGDLRESAHPKVYENGALVYDRPPIVGRLSRAQLKAKAEAAERGEYHRDYLASDHPGYGTLHRAHGGTHDYSPTTKPAPIV